MKKIFGVLIFFLGSCGLFAQDSTRNWYVTTNVLAPVAGMHKESAVATALLPLVSNMEYGVTLSGGFRKQFHAMELRFTYGSSNPYNRIPQLQAGYHIFVPDYFKHNNSGWYAGGNFRLWQYNNLYTDTHLNNASINAAIGYQKFYGHFLMDIRMLVPIAIYSVSNIPHTEAGFNFSASAMPELSPVLPFFSLNLGYGF